MPVEFFAFAAISYQIVRGVEGKFFPQKHEIITPFHSVLGRLIYRYGPKGKDLYPCGVCDSNRRNAV
jgi:hypothetical protein